MNLLKNHDLKNKTVLCRVDLNVPMKNGRVQDATRLNRVLPTIKYLIKQKAKVVLLSHFGRPKGEFIRDMSLAPLADSLGKALNTDVKFAIDCIGDATKAKINDLQAGEVLLLENLRFHAGETSNNAVFVEKLAQLGDFYINDTFSCSHRKHASIVGLAKKLPSAAGLLLQEEIENLEKILNIPQKPMAVIVGGSKVSSKLDLLEALITKAEILVIGGAMANTFLKAKGNKIGKSLYEPELVDTAKEIMAKAEKNNCEIFLPSDVAISTELKDRADCKIVSANKVPSDSMILDLGPQTIADLAEKLKSCKTVVWNGPIGAFEYRPFDVGSITLARYIASLTADNKIIAVAGGGDVVAALGVSGLTESFTYISTAGGAFLQWLQGKSLPGIEVLRSA